MADPGITMPAAEPTIPPGHRERVAALIYELARSLAKGAPPSPQHMSLLRAIDSPEHSGRREQIAESAIGPGIALMEVIRRVLNATSDYLDSLGLTDRPHGKDIEFTQRLLSILQEPDADEIRAAQNAPILARIMTVVERAVPARTPNQNALLHRHNNAVVGLLDQLRRRELDIEAAISRISAETVWLLCELRVDKDVLSEMPGMDSDVLTLLEAIEASVTQKK